MEALPRRLSPRWRLLLSCVPLLASFGCGEDTHTDNGTPALTAPGPSPGPSDSAVPSSNGTPTGPGPSGTAPGPSLTGPGPSAPGSVTTISPTVSPTVGSTGAPPPGPTGPSGPAQGSCAATVTSGQTCNPSVDTAPCQAGNSNCSCGADSLWACTPNTPGAGGTPSNPTPSGSAGAGGTVSGNGGMPGAGGENPMGPDGNETQTWLGVWGGAPQLTETNNNPPMSLANNTLRQLAYVSLGGSEVRLQLSNEFGDGPVTINKVHIAQSAGGGAITASTDVALTFDGSESVTINQGEAVYSDAVAFDLPELTSVAISIQFGSVPGGITGHPGSRTTSYIASGDAVSNETLSGATTTDHWYYISRLEVMAPASAGAIVCLGDSITDGRGSTTNMNNRWPDALARRLRANPDTPWVSVVNVGIGGNTVVSMGNGPNARSRFDRDVLGTANVRWVLIMEGVNDIGGGNGNASAITEAYQEFIDKAHAADGLAYGIPILPVKGSNYEPGEATRLQINDWIRTSGAFDAVLPLDEAVADPNDPNRLAAGLHDGDWLHLNPQGYQAVADAIDLSLFVTER